MLNRFCNLQSDTSRFLGKHVSEQREITVHQILQLTVRLIEIPGNKISRCFCPNFFLLSLGVSRGILVVFEAPGRSNVHVWSFRAVV